MDVEAELLPASINPNNFPAKLWRLVCNPVIKSIFWDSQGEAIIIERQRFEEEILCPSPTRKGHCETFKTKNFSSFVRQLNLYGFRKVDPAKRSSIPPSYNVSTVYHFSNPNFRRKYPHLMRDMRRLTVENKAKLQAGLAVNYRRPTRRRQANWVDTGEESGRKGNPVRHTPYSDTSYFYSNAPAGVAQGAPVGPRYITADRGGAALSPQFLSSGLMSSGGPYTGVAPSSNMLHIQQKVFNVVNPPGHPGAQVFQPYQQNPVASNMNTGLFPPPSMYYQAGFPVHQVCHDDFTVEQQRAQNSELPTCDLDTNAMFQICDEIILGSR